MNISRLYQLILAIPLLLIPIYSYADGISPLLYTINLTIFFIGQFWIVFSEAAIMKRFIPKLSLIKSVWWSIIVNFASTIPGVFIIPIIEAYVFILINPLNLSFGQKIVHHSAIFEWTTAALIIAVAFIVTYFLSAWIEYQLFYLLQKKQFKLPKQLIRKFSYQWNLVSYLGVLLLYL